ncbi:MAG TPA: adenylate/guanylate cyclase domain-containing protein [Candidatus Binatia bacterium]|nr:adenylate/guanylate cyclase domain-containing protein [Candidatus Binatia bacterium]
MTPRHVHSEILTVMFIDMVGYTRTTSRLSREEVHQLITDFDQACIPIFHHFHGFVLKKIGDAFLVTFRSATDAVLCGIELQKAFAKQPVQIRVAIHTGEVVHRDNDIYGDTVNTAARIEGVAEAGQIMFSETVFHAMNKNEIQYVHVGVKRLKGLKHPVRLFRVLTKEDVKRRRRASLKGKVRGFLFWLVLIAIAGAIAYAFFSGAVQLPAP